MEAWGKLKRWQRIAIIAAGITALAFATSYLFSASYQVCSATDANQHQDCATYHLGPAVLAWIVGYTDQHNGLVTAIATIFIAIFTIILSSVTSGTLKLARDEFSATHRPRIIVREVYWSPDKADAVIVMVGNQGSRTARIAQLYMEFDRTDPRPIMHASSPNITKEWLIGRGSFEALTWTIEGDEKNFALGAFQEKMLDSVTFQGLIIYMDDNGAYYRSVFKRVCLKGEAVFRRTANPDDEYGD